jgi:hypothetical protein
MNYGILSKAGSFHRALDTELIYWPGHIGRTSKYMIIQERDVSYRFYLHQHPYVQQLLQGFYAGEQLACRAQTEHNTASSLWDSDRERFKWQICAAL